MRQLNFSSFGTQLVAPGGEVPPPSALGPEDRACRPAPFSAPLGPSRSPSRLHRGTARAPYSQEGPTAIDPDLRAPNERDCQRKPTCRTRTCRTRFCVAPPAFSLLLYSSLLFFSFSSSPSASTIASIVVSIGPRTTPFPSLELLVSFILLRQPTAPPALLPYLPLPSTLSPDRPNLSRDYTSNSGSLSFLRSVSSSLVFFRCSHRVPCAICEGPCPSPSTGRRHDWKRCCNLRARGGWRNVASRLKIIFFELQFFSPQSHRPSSGNRLKLIRLAFSLAPAPLGFHNHA